MLYGNKSAVHRRHDQQSRGRGMVYGNMSRTHAVLPPWTPDSSDSQRARGCRHEVTGPGHGRKVLLKKYNIKIYIHTHINTYSYEHIYAHSTCMIIFERLNRFDLEIKSVIKSDSLSTGTSSLTERIISRKYNSCKI
jgi:hypothetical protein